MNYVLGAFLVFGAIMSEAFVTDNGCGILKSCVYFPMECDINSDSDCRFTAWSLSDAPDSIDIELRSGKLPSEPSYMAVALGTSSKMTNADLYFCTNSGLGSGFIDQPYNQPLELPLEEGLTLEKVAVVNGSLHCKFTRPLSVTKTVGDTDRQFNLSSTEFHLLVAQGKLDGGIISYHDWRASSANKINFVVNFGVEESLKNIPLPSINETQTPAPTTPGLPTTEKVNVMESKTMGTPEPVDGTTKMAKVDSESELTTKKAMVPSSQPQVETTSSGFYPMVMSSWSVLLVAAVFMGQMATL
ncbi:putative ferric-chelate reductase 1 [Styela clava]|uniref:uncharacterized protein LOC120335905 n=1 Tax=Styela clava TaxID=7725 RepID=UPI00193ACD0E|nr:uncharacterized protein LOC120335905 [Styela clava]